MIQINFSDLPEIIQTLLNQIKTIGEPLTIIQNGIPFMIISPIKKTLLEIFATLDDIEEDFPDVEEGLLPLDDIEL